MLIISLVSSHRYWGRWPSDRDWY